MKKINELNQKLQILESQKKNLNSLENTSIFQFIKYKSVISQHKKVSKQLEKIKALGNEINFWYDQSTKSWIENPKVSCRKYYRLERKAKYKKDFTLYKMGLSDKKPLSPLFQILNNIWVPISKQINEISQHIKFVFCKIKFSKFNLFSKISKSYKIFTSNILPQKINKLAVNAATLGIKGYRMFQSDCRYMRSFINSKDSIKYIKNVINTANMQVARTEKAKTFKESLKVNPSYLNLNNAITNSKKSSLAKISEKNNNSSCIDDYEYNL